MTFTNHCSFPLATKIDTLHLLFAVINPKSRANALSFASHSSKRSLIFLVYEQFELQKIKMNNSVKFDVKKRYFFDKPLSEKIFLNEFVCERSNLNSENKFLFQLKFTEFLRPCASYKRFKQKN